MSTFELIVIIVILIVVLGVVLADRNLDALGSETLAKQSALAHSGELLGRVNLEYIAENRSEHWRLAVVDAVPLSARSANIDKGKPQATIAHRQSPMLRLLGNPNNGTYRKQPSVRTLRS